MSGESSGDFGSRHVGHLVECRLVGWIKSVFSKSIFREKRLIYATGKWRFCEKSFLVFFPSFAFETNEIP